MKLRDFNKKPNPSKAPRSQKIEAERDVAVSKFTAIEDTLKSERIEFQKNIETIQALELEIKNLNETIEKLPRLEEDLRAAKGIRAMTQNELDAMTKRAMEQSKELSFLKPQLETLRNELEETSKQTKQAVSLKQSTDADFEAVSNKNKELQSFTDETSKINKDLIEENKTLRDWANYKEVENKELLVQLEELKTVETKLREWMSKMETKESQNTSSKNSLDNKVSTQQKVIADMSKTLDDMMKELAYVTKLNNEYRKELAKPTYTSMAAIASQEGFVMPNGKENTRTHNLGNYKPTMLKFKKKEETQNGR